MPKLTPISYMKKHELVEELSPHSREEGNCELSADVEGCRLGDSRDGRDGNGPAKGQLQVVTSAVAAQGRGEEEQQGRDQGRAGGWGGADQDKTEGTGSRMTDQTKRKA